MYDDLFNELQKKQKQEENQVAEEAKNEVKTEEIKTEEIVEEPKAEVASQQIKEDDKNIYSSSANYMNNNPYSSYQQNVNQNQPPMNNPYYVQVPSQANNGYNQNRGEYHYSYVNNNPYKQAQTSNPTPRVQTPTQNTNYQANPYQNPVVNTQKPKKEKARVGAGTVAIILAICMVLSAACGFGGTMLYKAISGGENSSNDAVVVHQVAANTQTASENLVDKSTSEIAEEVADSVVEVTTEVITTNSFYGQYVSEGAGSGVIISQDGYIITNNHVIDGASKIAVTLRNGDNYEAKLVGTDEEADVALIKVEATGLKEAVFGDSSTLKVGDKVVAIGNPLGTLGGSVSDGIVSALDRKIEIDGETMTLLQTDTAINPGNSGGGLFNGQGELIGLVNAKSAGSEIEGLGFAIPINNVLNILSDLKQYGYVTGKPSMGVQLLDVTNSMYAAYYFGSQETGVYVYSVYQGTAAAGAGIQPGDRIVAVNGTEVTKASEVEKLVSDMKAGDEITITIDRSGKNSDYTFNLDEAKPSQNTSSKVNDKQNNDSNDYFGWPFG